jgi:hypothetical protein
MYKLKYLSAFILFITVFAVSCFVITKSDRQGTALYNQKAEYRWAESQIHYNYDTYIKNKISLNGEIIENKLAINSILNIKIFEVGEVIKAGMYASPVSVDNNGIKDNTLEYVYRIPVLAEIDKTGKFISMRFPANTSEKQRKSLRGYYSAIEAVLHTEESYRIKQHDSAGEYLANYSLKGKYLKKIKSEYLPQKKSDDRYINADIKINNSEYIFEIKPENIWITSAKGEENISYEKSSGEKVLDSDLSIKLMKLNENNEDKAKYFESKTFAEVSESFAKGVKIYRKKTFFSKTEEKHKKIISENEVEKYLKNLGERGRRDVSLKMREFLLKNPEIISRFPSMIQQGRLEDNQAMELIKIFGIIGIPEAQKALIEITKDVNQTDNNRLRAVISFTSMRQPPIEDVKKLFIERLDSIQNKGESIGLYTSSVLALGAISKNIHEDYPLESEEIGDMLSEKLFTATGMQQKYLLKSIGNTYNEKYSRTITEYTSAYDKEIRRAAVESLKYMEDPYSENILKERFSNEIDNDVKYSIVKTLDYREITPETFSKIISHAPDEESTDVRRSMIEMIDKRIEDYPNSKSTLEEMLRNETSEVNIRKIIEAAGRLNN